MSSKLMSKVNPWLIAPMAGQLLLAPVAAVGYSMALWCFASDMNWLGEFVISSGMFASWQVWLALAIAAQIAARHVERVLEGTPQPVPVPVQADRNC